MSSSIQSTGEIRYPYSLHRKNISLFHENMVYPRTERQEEFLDKQRCADYLPFLQDIPKSFCLCNRIVSKPTSRVWETALRVLVGCFCLRQAVETAAEYKKYIAAEKEVCKLLMEICDRSSVRIRQIAAESLRWNASAFRRGIEAIK